MMVPFADRYDGCKVRAQFVGTINQFGFVGPDKARRRIRQNKIGSNNDKNKISRFGPGPTIA